MGRKLQPGIDKISEGWVKKEVKSILKKYAHILVDMPPAGMYGSSGRHDFQITQKGLFWTIETKAGANKPTALQISYAKSVKEAWGISVCINEFNLHEVEEIASYIDRNASLPYSDIPVFEDFSPKQTKINYEKRKAHKC